MNQIRYEWSLSNEELEALYQEDQSQKEKIRRDLGKYVADYDRAVAVLHAKVDAYLDEQKACLYESFKKKNSMMQSYYSVRRAA